MKKLTFILCLLLVLSCKDDDPTDYVPAIPNADERVFAGGETTVFSSGSFSFENPATNLEGANLDLHLAGDAQFEAAFVTAPADVNPGLGLQFNNTSCIACHPRDGRSAFPSDINDLSGFFLRISVPGNDPITGAPNNAPGFGNQLANHATYGITPEVQFAVNYEDVPVSFADGTTVILKKPIYSISESYIPLPAGYMLSPRIGPPVIGLGLLEAISEEDILAKQDINDIDSDGISGKANYVWDEVTQTTKLGRFGWKANTPSIVVQSAGAYNNDMGITTPLFPIESSYGQSNGESELADDPEIPQRILDEVTFYCQTLAVPAARNLEDEDVRAGYQIFEDLKCASCHTPRHVTGSLSGIPEVSNQVIYPYTDMLLHDMGEGLADGRSDFLADGNEWKTRPLWGIGLTNIVNGHTNFLHDGRARNIEEAILWHGGEAEQSKTDYTQLSLKERQQLIKFVESL
jgi:CxxC motif-containing protein (DUF1111 family)